MINFKQFLNENNREREGSVVDLNKERLIKTLSKAADDVKSGRHQQMMDRRAFELHKAGHLPLPVGTRVFPPRGWDMPGNWHIHGYWQDILKPEKYGYKLKNDRGDNYIVHNVKTHVNPHIFGGGFRAFTGPSRSDIAYPHVQSSRNTAKVPNKDKINAEYDELFGTKEN